MMFHHLSRDEQPRMLREARRILKPGGRLELLDFAAGGSDAAGALGHLFHAHDRLAGNAPERIVALMAAAGFETATMTRAQRRFFGRLAFYEATVAG